MKIIIKINTNEDCELLNNYFNKSKIYHCFSNNTYNTINFLNDIILFDEQCILNTLYPERFDIKIKKLTYLYLDKYIHPWFIKNYIDIEIVNVKVLIRRNKFKKLNF